MIKLGEKASEYDASCLAATTSRELIGKRMSLELFEDAATVDCLVEHSGGHTRDLIRLLRYTLREAQSRPITRSMSERAVKELASEYSRLIEQDDDELLASVDRSPPDHTPVSDRTRRLLYDLALLEYNAYWWQSHPVVRTLPAYDRAADGSGPPA